MRGAGQLVSISYAVRFISKSKKGQAASFVSCWSCHCANSILKNFDYRKLNSDTHECIQIMSQLYSIKCYLQTPLNYALFHFSTQQVHRYYKITKFLVCVFDAILHFCLKLFNWSIKCVQKMQTRKCRAQWIFKNRRQACNRHPDQKTEHLAK